MIRSASRLRGWMEIALLAALAYIPALASSPGRMPADTKLYLYLDPGGLLGRAGSTFEAEQFAGWVPHQQIAYLWPTGPWYWFFDAVGVPDWIAHRLWIATVLFAGGAGVRWMARQLGLPATAATVAAVFYQLSPYILPYISRTSVMLLPWAGLGWIVGLTIRATRRSPEGWLARWREPALIALVVATIGAVNATALALIAPAPLLWLLHATLRDRASWRHTLGFVARTAVLCIGASLWWMAMLVVQSRNGAPVLEYSESLEDVSRNSTGSEVLRGLGYWLFYFRDSLGPATTSSLDYLVSLRAIAVSYLVSIVALAGLTFVRWPERRFAGWLVATGMILAVGVHPFGSSSPFMSFFAGDDGSGLALALRSSTRALPLFVLGLALATASIVAALERLPSAAPARRWLRPSLVGAGIVVVLLVANLPSLWKAQLVDPAIDRDENVPTAWSDGAALLDERAAGFRVLQLPGAEFGSYRWGHTVDQPLPGLTNRPVVTRDLLPLGSGAAMDVLYSLDDRVQEGWLETNSVAPLSRLLGSDVVWLTNDMAFERYRTARPELLDDQLGAADVDDVSVLRRIGEPTANVADVAMVDGVSLTNDSVGRPIAPVTMLEVESPLGVIRSKTGTILVSGSADGLVDAAAARLIDGTELIRYSASLDGGQLADAVDSARLVLITDSNRDRAHHWRGSQDVHGFTESGGPSDGVLVPTSADQRLDVFATDDERTQTVALQRGPVRAIASSYGEAFAYRPEDRAVNAIDGDPSTAWRVADHADPIGERILLEFDDPVDSLRVVQSPIPSGGRSITAVRITADGDPDSSFEVALDESSLAEPGRSIDLPSPAGKSVEIEIVDVAPGDPLVDSGIGPVGFSTIDVGLGSTTEVVRTPVDLIDAVGDSPLAIALTRLRTDPLNRWRSDPELELVREIELPTQRDVDLQVTMRLDQRASDELLNDLLDADLPAVVADRRLPGTATATGRAAFDGDPATAWITPFDGAVGASVTFDAEPSTNWTISQPVGDYSPITQLTVSDGTESIDLLVPPANAEGVSVIAVPDDLSPGPLKVTVSAVESRLTRDRRFGDVVQLPAAITEIDLGNGGSGDAALDRERPVGAVCSEAFLTIDGEPIALSFETTVGALIDGAPIVAEPCEGVSLDVGSHVIASTGRRSTGLTVDRVVLSDLDDATSTTTSSQATAPVVTVTRSDARHRSVVVGPCPQGCWLVLGEGYNTAWAASGPDGSLGPPELVDGGFNGWFLPPTDASTTVELRWTAQRPVTIGLLASAMTVLLCLAIGLLGAVVDRRRNRAVGRPQPTMPPASFTTTATGSTRAAWFCAVALVLGSATFIAPIWGLAALVPAALVIVARYRAPSGRTLRILEVAGFGLTCAVVLAVMWLERRNRPFPNSGWTESMDRLNGLTLFAIAMIVVGTSSDAGEQSPAPDTD